MCRFARWHFLTFAHDTGSVLSGLALTAYLLLPLVASRIVVGWLYNASGASVLIRWPVPCDAQRDREPSWDLGR